MSITKLILIFPVLIVFTCMVAAQDQTQDQTKDNHPACHHQAHVACIWQGNVHVILRRLPWNGRERRRPGGQRTENSTRRPYHAEQEQRREVSRYESHFQPPRHIRSSRARIQRDAGVGTVVSGNERWTRGRGAATRGQPYPIRRISASEVGRLTSVCGPVQSRSGMSAGLCPLLVCRGSDRFVSLASRREPSPCHATVVF